MRRANIYSGGFLALLGLAMILFVIPAQIEEGPAGMMSPRLVPQMIMGLMTALSVMLVVRNLMLPDDGEGSPVSRSEYIALLKIGSVFALALVLFYFAGPLWAGLAIVLGSLLALGERRPLVLVLMPIALLAGVWVLFYRVLGTAIL
ncbi:tripartite tricarboxylate transporter TctB family protein [Seohaeicola zhoushanensis]|uniref:C4-dicarboxylate ABC transporter permease n=1 Tax=Seohaeicola zhoushanensis TaxID=1569283 RepID=A0A8J3H2V1_9RHOB|nr:tripartite tricarboxylate transporter TctB family protein [Seohaeicola zhoushanensis]GHF70688.1 C4-dicarboxylate ABC transporter permease [Seohaeicola zhoushanensis]